MDNSERMELISCDSNCDSESETELSVTDSSESLLDDLDSSDSDSSTDGISQARQFFEISCDNPSDPPPRFAFAGIPKINLDIDETKGKLQFYDAFIDDYLLDLIVFETNRYAKQCIKNSTLRRHSRSKKWTPTSKDELHVFFALNILQGIVKKPVVEQYWSKKHSTSTPFFQK
ncbi:piggyBac transposable element-derived protein 4-like [Stegodyphus dumicola]|uniref:piggyBac transposable element-derived protein 4-like n=1 Tax=Stegodyphus dumicola TaxID=202533 RepID=UPI0015A84AAA|nr:piggyBac transposable element-derived protein 4-like [Stegodyphus dumicola]